MLIPFADVLELWNPRYPPRVLHCGAHLAEEADAYEHAEVEQVLWVEANPDLIGPLQRIVTSVRAQHRTVHMVAHAVLGAVDGEQTTLNIAAQTMQSSVLQAGTEPAEYVASFSAASTAVDTLVEGWGQPTFLNLDLQGYELEVLRGATRTLAGVECVYSEVSEIETYVGAPHWSKIDKLLKEAGFRLGKVEMTRSGEGWGDGCWIREGCG